MSDFNTHTEKYQMFKSDADNESNSIPTRIEAYFNASFHLIEAKDMKMLLIKTVISERKLSSFIKWFVKTAIEDKLFNTVEEDEGKGICYYKFEYQGGSVVSFTKKIGKKRGS